MAGARHISHMWVVFLLSIGFFAGIGWDYRSEFRSVCFVLFFSVWLLLNFAMFYLTLLGHLGWLYYSMALFVEMFLFHLTAYLLFDLQPPVRRQRTR
jgi:hypothetical protein